jgi:hypothetical protein
MLPEGEWGLRHRLRVALEEGYDEATLAAQLDISEATLHEYLTNPEYVLEGDDLANVVANLPQVETPNIWYDHTISPGGIHITYAEAPYWDETLLDTLIVPEGCHLFKVHYLPYEDAEHPISTPLYDIDDQNPINVAMSVTGGNLELLVSIVFYVYPPIVE